MCKTLKKLNYMDIIYTDDLAAVYPERDMKALEQKMNKDLVSTWEWFIQNSCKINEAKSI